MQCCAILTIEMEKPSPGDLTQEQRFQAMKDVVKGYLIEKFGLTEEAAVQEIAYRLNDERAKRVGVDSPETGTVLGRYFADPDRHQGLLTGYTTLVDEMKKLLSG